MMGIGAAALKGSAWRGRRGVFQIRLARAGVTQNGGCHHRTSHFSLRSTREQRVLGWGPLFLQGSYRHTLWMNHGILEG